MLEHYFAALIALRQTRGLAHSALPDAPVRPDRKDRGTDPNRRSQPPPPADPHVAGGPKRFSPWDPCPCGWWGVSREDRHGCAALVKELFPELDRELDDWDAAYGALYR
jgi:hypothetical protein